QPSLGAEQGGWRLCYPRFAAGMRDWHAPRRTDYLGEGTPVLIAFIALEKRAPAVVSERLGRCAVCLPTTKNLDYVGCGGPGIGIDHRTAFTADNRLGRLACMRAHEERRARRRHDPVQLSRHRYPGELSSE